jgi:phenylalanyl-tRNA synthetase beta chain
MVVFDVLLEMASESQYREVARLMPLERDLAVIVPEDVPAGEVQQVVAQAADSVDEIVLFDVYTQPPIPQGMKSLAMRLRYQPRDRTLTEEDLTQDRKRILRVLEEKFGARQRV